MFFASYICILIVAVSLASFLPIILHEVSYRLWYRVEKQILTRLTVHRLRGSASEPLHIRHILRQGAIILHLVLAYRLHSRADVALLTPCTVLHTVLWRLDVRWQP